MEDTRGSESLLSLQAVTEEAQTALQNYQSPARHVKSWNAHVRKILRTASPVLSGALSHTWVCLFALPRSCTWVISYAGRGAVVTDLR